MLELFDEEQLSELVSRSREFIKQLDEDILQQTQCQAVMALLETRSG